jgi:membrane protein
MKLSTLAIFTAIAVGLGAVWERPPAPLARVAGAASGAADALAPSTSPRSETNFFMRVYQDMSEDRLLSVAAGVGFYALLSIVPTLAAAVSLFGLFIDPQMLTHTPDMLGRILPAEAIKLVQGEASRLAAQPPQALSVKLGVSLALSIWTASAATKAIIDALNVIQNKEEGRNILRLYATAIAMTLAGVVVMTLAVLMIGADPKAVALGPLTEETVFLYSILRWPLFFAVAVTTIAALYRFGPTERPAPFLRLLPGAAVAALLWAGGSSLFGWYVSKLANYSATYGSLGTVAILMTWLWLSAAIVLLGAQINYEFNRGPQR